MTNTHTLTGAERNAAAQTIEWPYGFGEKFSGNVSDAAAHAIHAGDAEPDALIAICRTDYDNFTTLELFEETEIECYSGNDCPYKTANRKESRFIARIYCEKLPV
jgi:hypothetical protein